MYKKEEVQIIQDSMFDIVSHDEELIYKLLEHRIAEIVEENHAPADLIRTEQRIAFFSVFLHYKEIFAPESANADDVGRVVFRIICQKQRGVFEIPPSLVQPGSSGEEKAGFVRFYFDYTKSSVMEHSDKVYYAVEKAIDSIKKEFGCCGRYQQCSNAGKCINPNKELAIKCSYRINLKNGKVFY